MLDRREFYSTNSANRTRKRRMKAEIGLKTRPKRRGTDLAFYKAEALQSS